MAPEIISHKAYSAKAADVWALGVLLFNILCGFCPFRGKSDSETRGKIERGLYSVPDYVSKGANRFIAKMLKVNAESRCDVETLLKEKWIQEADMY